MNLNQLTLIGLIGKNAETSYLPNGTPVTKSSVAPRRLGRTRRDGWQGKTHWHNVVAFGKDLEQLA